MDRRHPSRPAASGRYLRGPALRPGDTVMLVSPSGPTRPERVARGVELLTGWGLNVRLGPSAYARHGFLAGTDRQRLDDLNAALADPAVRAVVCTRGGYGTQRIVDGIDADAVRADPKAVVGFSDITALQLALWRIARLAGVHGPGAAWLDRRTPQASADSLRAALMTREPVVVTAVPGEDSHAATTPAGDGPHGDSPDGDGPDSGAPVSAAGAGTAEGVLLGGNLSLLTSTLGTHDFPDLRGAILLIEEVEEPPYKVDRMLTHLRRSGVLAGVAGIALGQFTNCADNWPMTVVDVLRDRLGDLGVPVLGGLPVGHGHGQVTVPVGTPARLDVAAGTLTVSPAVR